VKAQYVGDIGDFGKVLLLKSLSTLGFRVGVNWVLTQDDEGSDGKHRDYPWYGIRHRANNPLYSRKRTPDNRRDCLACCCDEEILRRMALLARKRKEERKIQDLEGLLTEVLLTVPTFFTKNYDDVAPRNEKNKAALRELETANLIFFDPDNGLSFQDAEVRKSPKHIYLDELTKYWAARKSLLVYHHWGHPAGGIPLYMDGIESKLRCALNGSELIHQYSFRRGSGRTYFLVVHPDHAESIRNANKEIVRAIEPLTYTVKEWRHKAIPCSASHIWQIS
jgi:hypothetical protein